MSSVGVLDKQGLLTDAASCLFVQANWRKEVAKDIQLLRRTGPYQLALLSHLRRDDKIMPVLKAVWHQNLHSSCPSEVCGKGLRLVHWRPVAESLLREPTFDVTGGGGLQSQRHSGEVPELLMPGSAAVMQVVFPQLEGCRGIREEDFLTVVLEQSRSLAAVLQRCVPPALWAALTAAGKAALADGDVGLLGEDTMVEVAARACAVVPDWPGRSVFESAHSHLNLLMQNLIGSLPDIHAVNGSDLQLVVRALAPAVASFFLQPVAERVAALQLQFPSASCWDAGLSVQGTLNQIRERCMAAAFRLHVADLEQTIQSASGRDLQEPLRVFLTQWKHEGHESMC